MPDGCPGAGWLPAPGYYITPVREALMGTLQCGFQHRRSNAPAAYLVGPVLSAEAVLACGVHLTTAVDQLTAACRPIGSFQGRLPSRVPQIPVRVLIAERRR